MRSVSGNGKGKRGNGNGGNKVKESSRTTDDLDSELEAFMKAPPGTVGGSNGTEKSDHAPMVSLRNCLGIGLL